MKIILQNLDELTDSKELLESKPHPFTSIFIYILMAILLIGLIWSYVGQMDVVVKAQGIVRPYTKISTINNRISGKVLEVYLEEGKKVKKGDILYTLEHLDLISNEKLYRHEWDEKTRELKNLNKLKQSILENKNLFNLKEEKSSYDQYLKYTTDKMQSVENVNLFLSKIDTAKNNIKNLSMMLDSIHENSNLFKDIESEYYTQYVDYNLALKDLENLKDQKKRDFDIQSVLYESRTTPKIEYDNAKHALEKSELDVEKFKSEKKLFYQSKLEEETKNLDQLNIQLRQTTPSESKDLKAYSSIAKNQFQTKTLIEIDEKIKRLETECNNLKNQLDQTHLNIDKCIVKAPIDGFVNMLTPINQGDNVQAATPIATIIPNGNKNYKMEIYASNEDIANIRIGDEVTYNFLALPYKEYGELTGKITKISKDIKNSKDQKSTFYLVEANIENKPLKSYKGEKKSIQIGMSCEARIITKTKKILHYLLEKIDLRV